MRQPTSTPITDFAARIGTWGAGSSEWELRQGQRSLFSHLTQRQAARGWWRWWGREADKVQSISAAQSYWGTRPSHHTAPRRRLTSIRVSGASGEGGRGRGNKWAKSRGGEQSFRSPCFVMFMATYLGRYQRIFIVWLEEHRCLLRPGRLPQILFALLSCHGEVPTTTVGPGSGLRWKSWACRWVCRAGECDSVRVAAEWSRANWLEDGGVGEGGQASTSNWRTWGSMEWTTPASRIDGRGTCDESTYLDR